MESRLLKTFTAKCHATGEALVIEQWQDYRVTAERKFLELEKRYVCSLGPVRRLQKGQYIVGREDCIYESQDTDAP